MSGLDSLPEVLGIPSSKLDRDLAPKKSGRRLGDVRVPVGRRRSPALWVSRCAPKLGDAPVESVERPEVGPHVARERANSPASEPAPIDLARKPFQSVAGLGTENSPRVVPRPQPPVEVVFFLTAPLLRKLARRNLKRSRRRNVHGTSRK